MPTLSVVIPALNEAVNIRSVIASVPVDALAQGGWHTEIIVVDNGSTDGTGALAREAGATLVYQPARGYGNAYLAGIEASTGTVVATGDADCTYPFEDLPTLLERFVLDELDFLNTDRLSRLRIGSMVPHHIAANFFFTAVTKVFFKSPFRDSQSGMWIFSRAFWESTAVRSPGMAFSQEIKMTAHLAGFRTGEVPIDYRIRGGEKKLNSLQDGLRNLAQLVKLRFKVTIWAWRDAQARSRRAGTDGGAGTSPASASTPRKGAAWMRMIPVPRTASTESLAEGPKAGGLGPSAVGL